MAIPFYNEEAEEMIIQINDMEDDEIQEAIDAEYIGPDISSADAKRQARWMELLREYRCSLSEQ